MNETLIYYNQITKNSPQIIFEDTLFKYKEGKFGSLSQKIRVSRTFSLIFKGI